MIKIAIFVEGQSELITLREFLLREFEYVVDIECRTLFKPTQFNKTPYDFTSTEAKFHFQIINVGNDNAVLKRILKREQYMWNSGYDRIIGLRDMYSQAYREEAQEIDDRVTQKFIQGAHITINDKATDPEKITMCFAIMEVEAWFLAMYNIFEKLDNRLSTEFIKDQTGIDLEKADPETEFFHPSEQMEEIYKLTEKTYDKHKGDIEQIAKYLSKEEYADLLASDKCNSFNTFYKELKKLDSFSDDR